MPLLDTYGVLLKTVTAEMIAMDKLSAQALANELTIMVSQSIAQESSPHRYSAQAERLIPRPIRNRGLLGLGWDAFRQTHETVLREMGTQQAEVVCTLPYPLRTSLAANELGRDDGVWAGSLMQTIHQIINSAERSLTIVAPYWSEIGVDALLRHISFRSRKGLQVAILTQPEEDLGESGERGLMKLCTYLMATGAAVTIYHPIPVENYAPLVHAKVIIRDDHEAYVGSANFSVNGIDQSVEIGVRLLGHPVGQLTAWAKMLTRSFRARKI